MEFPFDRELSRRELLRAGAIVAGAAGVAAFGLPAITPTARAATRVRRCVTLGAAGVIRPGGTQDYRHNRRLLLETGTDTVRMWADWPSLQPDKGSGAWRLRELDRQITQANEDRIDVILTSYRFPVWAGGGRSLFDVPDDLSHWQRWIDFLVERYGSRIAFLEVCNEPNLQFRARGDVHLVVADMFETAQRIAQKHGNAPLLCGPATSDGEGYDAFTVALLDELERRGFDGGRTFAWSHHNFTDVERDEGTRAARVRTLLTGRWRGWPDGEADAPQLLIPEGGARLTRIAGADRDARQAELIRRNWERMSGPDGAGIAMIGQYLFSTDPNYDSGLCEADGSVRPAYTAWAATAERP